jgi:hypothetical protein
MQGFINAPFSGSRTNAGSKQKSCALGYPLMLESPASGEATGLMKEGKLRSRSPSQPTFYT